MTSAYSINLNFNNTIPVKTDFTFKQGDKGITLNLATTGLDTTGTTAHIVFKRSNGTSVEAELTGQTGPSYSYTILGNEFEIPGVVVADLKLYNGDTQRVSTASFIFLVTGDTMDGVGGGTGGYSDQLEELSQEFSDTLEEYKDAFGDVGAVNPRGAYDSTEDYNVLDLVSYQGSSYLCRTACKNKVPTDTTYWQVFASGGGGTDDYEDLENKPSINGVELSGDKSTGDLGIEFNDLDDVDMTGVTDGQVPTWDASEQKYKPGTPAAGGGTNPNLLINPWFTVNQRGKTSGDFSVTTKIDCWSASYATSPYGTWTLSDGVLTLNAPSGSIVYWLQKFENASAFNNKVLTGSILFSDGTIVYGTMTRTNDMRQTFVDADAYEFYFNAGNALNIAIKVNKSISIRAVKLEIGSESTLHLDIAPDYTTELLKCQRCYKPILGGYNDKILSTVVAIGPAAARLWLPIIPMRTTSPTAKYTSLANFKLKHDNSEYALTSISVGISTANMAEITFSVSSGLTQGSIYNLLGYNNDILALDAEL